MSDAVLLTFEPGNGVRYVQDMCAYDGLPAGVAFELASFTANGGVTLQAPGYGCLDGRGYGNGKLTTWNRGVVARARGTS